MVKDLHGIIVPLVTPWRADESLDVEALRRIVEHLIAKGGHGPFPAGSQGEFYALSCYAQAAGADAVALITPYFIRPNEDALRVHCAK